MNDKGEKKDDDGLNQSRFTDEQVLKYVEELSILYRTEKEKRNQLREVNKELEDFLFTASHDLQEPLRRATTFSDLVEKEAGSNLNEKGKKYFERMRSSLSHAQELIYALLRYSEINSINQSKFEQVDLGQIVGNVVSGMKDKIDSYQGRVEIKNLPQVYAVSSLMSELFRNLIINSLKYSQATVPPEVQITSSQLPDDIWEIHVQDNGIGFDEKYIDRIFKPFQILDTQDKLTGTGVGLAICHKIVKTHGGTITAKSEVNKGAIFIITLPGCL